MARKGGKNRGCIGCGLGVLAFVAFWVMVFVVTYASRGHYHPHVPSPTYLPVPNALDDYIAAGQIVNANGGLQAVSKNKDYVTYLRALSTGHTYQSSPPISQPHDLIAIKQKIASNYASALQRMRTGFSKDCRVPPMREFGGTYPYMPGLRDLSSLLEIDAEVRVSRGDSIGAFKDAVDKLQLANHMVRGGNLFHIDIAARFKNGAAKIAAQSLDGLSLQQCDAMAKEVERILKTEPKLSEAVREEGIASLSGVQILDDPKQCERIDLGLAIHKGSLTLYTIEARGDPGLVDGAATSFARIRWHNGRDRILKNIEQFYKVAVIEADRPAALRRPLPIMKGNIEEQFAYLSTHQFHIFDAALTRERLIYCMLKLRSFRLKENRYPLSITELHTPSINTTDPYTGNPLIYRRTNTGYLLYSVGPNLKDDGGTPLRDDKFELPGDIGIVAYRTDILFGIGVNGYPTVPHMAIPPPTPNGSPTK